MSEELRKAAERVRDLFPPEGHEGRHSVDLENMSVECIADLMLLAGAYLATVQPDDAEPVTEAFLNETGFIYHGGEQSWLLDVIDVDGGEFCLEYYRDRVLVVGQVAFPAKTRGQVRRLIAALKGATP